MWIACAARKFDKYLKIVMRLKVIRIDLPLKHVMTVFRGTISVIRTVVVELEQDGLRGYGEAYEDQHWGVSVEKMASALEACKEEVSRYALADPYAFGLKFADISKDEPAAASALEMAACDLWGKLCNTPLWRVWRYDPRSLPISSYTLGLDSIYRILEKFNEQPDWPLYRVKLGSHEDMEILRELRKQTKAPFRLDVNGCWTAQQALDYVDELKTLNIELIEQPLHPEDLDGMAHLREVCNIPFIADESCRCEEDIEKCSRFFDGVNLKPVKFGGMNPTRRAIEKARSFGLKTMIGNTIESSIAASATSQFAPKLDYIYLDGPLLIDKKIGEGVQLDKGHILMSRENGVGVSMRQR